MKCKPWIRHFSPPKFQCFSSQFALHGLCALEIWLDDRGTGQWKWLEEVPRRTSLVPLAFPCFVLCLIGVETEALLDYQGRAGDHFHCALEPSPSHIRRRQKWLKSDFRGPPKSNPKSNLTSDFLTRKSQNLVTFRVKKLFSGSFRVTLGGPQKSLFSDFWATLNFSGFRGLWGVRTFTRVSLTSKFLRRYQKQLHKTQLKKQVCIY